MIVNYYSIFFFQKLFILAHSLNKKINKIHVLMYAG